MPTVAGRSGADNLPYEKVGKNEPVCIAEDVPFETPDSWEWAKIETISMPIGNKNNQIQSKEVLPTGKIPVVSQGKDLIDGYCNDVSKKIDVLPLVMFGDHTRNVKYIDFEFVIGADGTKFHKILSCNSEYIYYWMLYAAETLRNRGYARHYTLLKECFIPLPPLQEQVCIASKIKAILPLVEKYGCEESKRVSLDSAFPNLLKRSILQEAIQGKLVPQDPGDEPASVLLERIRAGKQKLIAEGKIKCDKHESVIFRRDNSHYEKCGSNDVCIDDEIPFDIPNSWCWTRLDNIITVRGGKRLPKGEKLLESPTDHVYIRVTDMKNNSIDLNDLHYIDDKVYREISNYIITKDDIYIVIVGSTIGKVGIVPNELDGMNLTENAARLTPYLVDKEYLLLALQTEYLQRQFLDKTNQVGQPKLALIRLKTSLIPMPPLEEQKRIAQMYKHLLLPVSDL